MTYPKRVLIAIEMTGTQNAKEYHRPVGYGHFKHLQLLPRYVPQQPEQGRNHSDFGS